MRSEPRRAVSRTREFTGEVEKEILRVDVAFRENLVRLLSLRLAPLVPRNYGRVTFFALTSLGTMS